MLLPSPCTGSSVGNIRRRLLVGGSESALSDEAGNGTDDGICTAGCSSLEQGMIVSLSEQGRAEALDRLRFTPIVGDCGTTFSEGEAQGRGLSSELPGSEVVGGWLFSKPER